MDTEPCWAPRGVSIFWSFSIMTSPSIYYTLNKDYVLSVWCILKRWVYAHVRKQGRNELHKSNVSILYLPIKRFRPKMWIWVLNINIAVFLKRVNNTSATVEKKSTISIIKQSVDQWILYTRRFSQMIKNIMLLLEDILIKGTFYKFADITHISLLFPARHILLSKFT